MSTQYRYVLEYPRNTMSEVGLPRDTRDEAEKDLAAAKNQATIWGVKYGKGHIETVNICESENPNP